MSLTESVIEMASMTPYSDFSRNACETTANKVSTMLAPARGVMLSDFATLAMKDSGKAQEARDDAVRNNGSMGLACMITTTGRRPAPKTRKCELHAGG